MESQDTSKNEKNKVTAFDRFGMLKFLVFEKKIKREAAEKIVGLKRTQRRKDR